MSSSIEITEKQGGIMISIKRNVPVVYFISDGQGHCKIGIASDIKNRFNTLQVGSAYELTITHLIYTETLDEARDLEREYHSALREYNIRGEWYDENIVENYYKYGTVEKTDKIYMCDVCPEFDIQDAGKLFMILLSSKTEEEAQERYEREMPEYWKQYDIQRWENFTGETPVKVN